MIRKLTVIFCSMLLIAACEKDKEKCDNIEDPLVTTPYNFEIPQYFPLNANHSPEGNAITVEGVKLGRKLFYEERLSADFSMSCASCHNQKFAFTDGGNRFSKGIDDIEGNRNSMPLFNLAWSTHFFWNGRRKSLEFQAHDPVVNPIEMHNTWPNAADAISKYPEYVALFKAAFGKEPIDSVTITKALAQFIRSITSSDSKYDKSLRGEYKLSFLEQRGRQLFFNERILNDDGSVKQEGADCRHCHNIDASGLYTDGQLHNNALDSAPDSGFAVVTGKPEDLGRFKTPSLRNISYTAPYMHDGRFATLREVIDFYSEELKNQTYPDISMKHIGTGGVRLKPQDKDALLAFLKLFDDTELINNPDYSDPDQ